MRLLCLMVMLTLVSCAKQAAEAPKRAPAAKPAPPPASHLTLELAKPTVISAPLPERYAGPLPDTVAGLAAAPPADFVAMLLDADDPVMRTRVLAALEAATREGPLPKELEDYYSAALPLERSCTWLAAAIPLAGVRARAFLFQPLSSCDDPRLAPLFERADAPDELVLDWRFNLTEAATAFSPRFLSAARREVKAAAATPDSLRRIGFGLANMDGPVLREVRALQQATGDPKRRATLALGLLDSRAPALQALGRKACEHPALRKDPMCVEFLPDPRRPTRTGEPAADAGVDAVVEYFGPASDEVARRFGPEVFLSTLERCARRGDWSSGGCLRQLALEDRPRALSFLRLHGPRLRGKHNACGVVARTLDRYPDGGVHARLVHDALLPAEAEDLEPVEVTADSLLTAADRLERFDPMTETFPNGHHRLLARLSRLAAPTLTGVVFEEDAPSREEAEANVGSYGLIAFLEGKRFVVTAKNHGDWYDLAAVLGLLNALLVERKSELRYVLLTTGDGRAAAIVGPVPVLEALADEGLLEVAGADDARNAGNGARKLGR